LGFSFFLGEALGSLRRNWVMTMAAVMTVFISMSILGVSLVTDRNLNQGTTSLENRILIKVFISDKATPQQVNALRQLIDGNKDVKTVAYVSKTEALARYKAMMGSEGQAILDNLPNNPLPASFEVQVKNPNEVETVAASFVGNPAVDDAVSGSGKHDSVVYARATVRKMLGTINLVEKAMWAAMAVFAIAAVLLISTTVRLSIFARRREIEIMRLVGATNWFIRWPFVVEGFITGFFGSLIAGVGVWAASVAVKNWINAQVNYLTVRSYPAWFQHGAWALGLVPTIVILGAVLGAVGGGLALRRYLRV
jgi:cell division transport system permease protein